MNFTSIWVQSIRRYSIPSLVILFSLILILKNQFDGKRLDEEGVYVIEKLITKEEYKSGAPIYKYEFFYRNKRYVSEVAGIGSGRVGDLYFIKVLPSNPSVGKVIDHVPVPDCLKMKDVPVDGWKELPKDTCKQ